MTPLDIIWLFIWFLVGIVVFQVHGIKNYWGGVDQVYSAIGILILVFSLFYGAVTLQNMTMTLIGSIIIGFLSTLAYLIGANISRAAQFGEISPKIVVYFLLFCLFLGIFRGII